jgi:hypothetical protein
MPNIDELFKRRDCDREIINLCLVCVGISGSNSAAMINETCYYTNRPRLPTCCPLRESTTCCIESRLRLFGSPPRSQVLGRLVLEPRNRVTTRADWFADWAGAGDPRSNLSGPMCSGRANPCRRHDRAGSVAPTPPPNGPCAASPSAEVIGRSPAPTPEGAGAAVVARRSRSAN